MPLPTSFGPLDLLLPPLVILLAILYIPLTILSLLTNLSITPLTTWPTFQRAWFARFWHFFGAASKPLFAPDIESLVRHAHGVVLDIGTGSGDWLYLFSPERNPRITKLLLVEPNRHFHATLRERAQTLGLHGKFEIVDGGVEDMARKGVEMGTVVDTVVTVHTLCSVPGVKGAIGELYRCLKPGGQWLVYEHVRVREGRSLAGVCQAAVNTIWPVFLDGCSLTRDTEDMLRHAGKWESVELRPGMNHGRFNQMPHIRGRLVKQETVLNEE